MKFFLFFFPLVTIFLGTNAQAYHPICAHPLYGAATDDVLYDVKAELSQANIELFEPFFVSAILNTHKPADGSSLNRQNMRELKRDLYSLVMKKAWFKLARRTRKSLLENKTFLSKLTSLGLTLKNEKALTSSFNSKTIVKYLNDPEYATRQHTFKDLLETLLDQKHIANMGPVLKNICQNFPPMELKASSSDRWRNIKKKISALEHDNVERFQVFLENNFALEKGLTPKEFPWKINTRTIDKIFALKKLISIKTGSSDTQISSVFSLTSLTTKPLSEKFNIALKDFLKNQEKLLVYLLKPNFELAEFFREENAIVLKEFTQAYSIHSLQFSTNPYKASSSHKFLSNQAYQECMKHLINLACFLNSTNSQLSQEPSGDYYSSFFKRYFYYHQSLNLSKSDLDKNIRINIDRNICEQLGLSFPCFEHAKATRLRLSKKSVNLFKHDLNKLSDYVGFHLEAIADFILTFAEGKKGEGDISEKLCAIRDIAVAINKTISTSQSTTDPISYLPEYNKLRRHIAQFENHLKNLVLKAIGFPKADVLEKSPENLELSRYITERIGHLI